MELQWPLILFTTLVAASAGTFATQGVYALVGKGQKAQLPALVVSAVLLVVGGIAVFMHLQHWERIFNGFGHITSGITQELIAIVAMAVIMVVFFILLRRSDAVPKWCGVLAIIVGAALVLVCGLSYMMPARPAWNSAFQILSLFGFAFAAGAGIFAAFDKDAETNSDFHGTYAIAGTVVNAVCTLVFLFTMMGSTGQYSDVGNYFDPNHPGMAMASASAFSPFSGDAMAYSVIAIILVLAAVFLAFYGKKSKKWMTAGIGIAVCVIIGAALLRAVFFICGGSVFMLY